jgi:hypothetical protein
MPPTVWVGGAFSWTCELTTQDWLNGVGGLCSDPSATARPAGSDSIATDTVTGSMRRVTLAVAPTASVAVSVNSM